MRPIVPSIVQFLARPAGWLAALRTSRLVARIEYQKGKRKAAAKGRGRKRSAMPTAAEREAALFTMALAALKGASA